MESDILFVESKAEELTVLGSTWTADPENSLRRLAETKREEGCDGEKFKLSSSELEY